MVRDLGIWGNALNLDRLQGTGEGAVPVGEERIGSCNALNMGTVFTGTVMIMGNVQILIYVVVTKRNLGIDIELPGVHPEMLRSSSFSEISPWSRRFRLPVYSSTGI